MLSAISLNDSASRATSSSPITGIRSLSEPSANRSATSAAWRTGRTTCRVTRFAMTASSSSSTTPPTTSVLCTTSTVRCSLVSGKIR